jgi:hypothetical protein
MSAPPQLSLFDARGASEPFAVRVSPRARRLTVRVHVGGHVEVVVPRGVAPGTVRAFVSRNTTWIDRKIAELGARVAPAPSVPDSVQFNATGERFLVHWHRAERARLRHDASTVHLQARDVPCALSLLREWLVQSAQRRLVPQIWDLSRELGFCLTGATIRRQRTRWGSCSSRGKISMNCSLLFMPPPVVRYLMVHELSHLQHLNHSSAFWSTVERHEPQYRLLDRQLTAGWRAVPDWVFKG